MLPAESKEFPKAAHAATESLSKAHIAGVDETHVANVTLEVAQLSIECVEPTASCYSAVGKQLSANRLLFAQIIPGPKNKEIKVTVTLFDVDASEPKRQQEKLYANEKEATTSIDQLVSEVVTP